MKKNKLGKLRVDLFNVKYTMLHIAHKKLHHIVT